MLDKNNQTNKKPTKLINTRKNWGVRTQKHVGKERVKQIISTAEEAFSLLLHCNTQEGLMYAEFLKIIWSGNSLYWSIFSDWCPVAQIC